MEKLKIVINQAGTNSTNDELIRQVCEDPALLELCNLIISNTAEAKADADAIVLAPSAEPAKCPAGATEIIVTDTVRFMPLSKEPTAEDVVRFRDILERDFDLRSPRIAIVQKTEVQSHDFANMVTQEHGINIYGPYSAEQIIADDKARHFDGIICADSTNTIVRIIKELSLEPSVRFFAGRESVVTSACSPFNIDKEEGLADISALTHPIYTAIDVIRNRAFFDEALQNPLPKLYRDKREDRRREDAPKANTNNDNTEKA